jgi:diadenosine tetraphosphate (Ap4A) HIT family hydrolase
MPPGLAWSRAPASRGQANQGLWNKRDMVDAPRRPLDMTGYLAQIRERCFICAIADGVAEYDAEQVLVGSPNALAFLDRYPVVFGHVLVAPRDHREDVVADFTGAEYLELQDVVRRVGLAVRKAVPCERPYIPSLGSQMGNAHVHWHLIPCPPGLPFEQHQLDLLRKGETGYVDAPREQTAALAEHLRHLVAQQS